jgi:hypothetical protein
MDTLGDGVKVFVLDAGLIATPFVSPAEVKTFTATDTTDLRGHGTRMAEIIASRDPGDLGIAPECDLYIAKVVEVGQGTSPIVRALRWAKNAGAQVVSMSFAYRTPDPDVDQALAELDAAGCICLAAYNAALPYPAACEHVVSCGTLESDADADALTVGEVTKRTPAGPLRPYRGSSISTAVLAGIAACAKSFQPSLTRSQFLAALAAG